MGARIPKTVDLHSHPQGHIVDDYSLYPAAASATSIVSVLPHLNVPSIAIRCITSMQHQYWQTGPERGTVVFPTSHLSLEKYCDPHTWERHFQCKYVALLRSHHRQTSSSFVSLESEDLSPPVNHQVMALYATAYADGCIKFNGNRNNADQFALTVVEGVCEEINSTEFNLEQVSNDLYREIAEEVSLGIKEANILMNALRTNN